MTNVARLVRTVVHMRPVQMTNRITRRFARSVDLSPADLPLRPAVGGWICCQGREPSMTGPDRVDLLSLEQDIDGAGVWNDPDHPKLWLYHLHYFDDLLAEGAGERAWSSR